MAITPLGDPDSSAFNRIANSICLTSSRVAVLDCKPLAIKVGNAIAEPIRGPKPAPIAPACFTLSQAWGSEIFAPSFISSRMVKTSVKASDAASPGMLISKEPNTPLNIIIGPKNKASGPVSFIADFIAFLPASFSEKPSFNKRPYSD